MNAWEIIGAITAVVVAIVQGYNAYILNAIRSDMKDIKLWAMEQFVTKESAKTAMEQMADFTTRIVEATHQKPYDRRH